MQEDPDVVRPSARDDEIRERISVEVRDRNGTNLVRGRSRVIENDARGCREVARRVAGEHHDFVDSAREDILVSVPVDIRDEEALDRLERVEGHAGSAEVDRDQVVIVAEHDAVRRS